MKLGKAVVVFMSHSSRHTFFVKFPIPKGEYHTSLIGKLCCTQTY